MILAFDTSNYTTSIAVLDGEDVVIDYRKLIDVKLGERGIRQSDGFFKHMQALDTWLIAELDKYIERLVAIAVSDKPRPITGSYMPVFRAGQIIANSIAHSRHLPCYTCSHQEGHLYSALLGNVIKAPFLFLHLSGGTTEVHHVTEEDARYQFSLISETADISVGQLVDRIGVKSGLKFPCGAKMDKLAVAGAKLTAPRFKMKNAFNLSGYENYFSTCLKKQAREVVYYHLFDFLANTIIAIVEHAIKCTGVSTVLIAGGVAENRVVRSAMLSWSEQERLNIKFAKPHFASDNAVGVARFAQMRMAFRTYGSDAMRKNSREY